MNHIECSQNDLCPQCPSPNKGQREVGGGSCASTIRHCKCMTRLLLPPLQASCHLRLFAPAILSEIVSPGFKWLTFRPPKRGLAQFSSVAQLCLTLCNPVNHSTPGLPVHHQLPESTQTHVHWGSDAIQPSHPLSSPSPPALNLSQHQGLFKWVSSSKQVAELHV